MKKWICLLMMAVLVFSCTACGSTGSGASASIEGELTDILAKLYEGADFDADMREAIQYYATMDITADNAVSILGTENISYEEGICSMPQMSSVAYQCVLLRVNPDEVDTIKQELQQNADVNKWVCISAEKVLVESKGDLILFVMSSEDVAYALSASFQALK